MANMTELKIRGKHEAYWVTISSDEYESLLATIEILSSHKAMEKIRKGEKERLEGKMKSLDQIKKELGF